MADKHGGACEGKPSIDWDALKDQLSVETLESLQQHLAEGCSEPGAARGAQDSVEASLAGANGRHVELPPSNQEYKDQDYWDGRFKAEDDYDWLLPYADMANHLREEIPKDARVLVVGCGNSALSADMYDDGYRDMLSTDFSAVVIDKMRARHASRRPGLRWEEMDMLALDLEDGSIDAVVDKAAMDALVVDKGDPWAPAAETTQRSHRMCSEIWRVLAPGGVFVQLSFEQPHFRKKLLLGEHFAALCGVSESEQILAAVPAAGENAADENLGSCSAGGIRGTGSGGLYGWDLSVRDIQPEDGCFGQFLYVMRKRGDFGSVGEK